ncbi:MAG: protein nirL [Acidithiobacillales bacterium SG8_45]|jgi:DNA-binding Lrp family transcriptional regulator|nr:MAG: protein nirL [Acidithiobacillales bacterium SG8_45]
MTSLAHRDMDLIAAIQEGLPLASRPYAAIGESIGMTEQEVMERLQQLHAGGVIKRLGVIVRHRELGYRANAMVVWDVADEQVAELGRHFSQFDFVTLCYQRPRRLPDWPYNLFCMIHGQDRRGVRGNIQRLVDECGVEHIPHVVLFSRRRFKQRGAIYIHQPEVELKQESGT